MFLKNWWICQQLGRNKDTLIISFRRISIYFLISHFGVWLIDFRTRERFAGRPSDATGREIPLIA